MDFSYVRNQFGPVADTEKCSSQVATSAMGQLAVVQVFRSYGKSVPISAINNKSKRPFKFKNVHFLICSNVLGAPVGMLQPHDYTLLGSLG